MNIPLPMFERAVSAHFGPDLSGRLAQAFNTIRARRARGSTGDAIVVPHDRVGDLLAEAVAPGVGLISARTTITSAKIIFGETLLETVVAADVTGHQLLGDWLPLTIGEALALPILEAATLDPEAIGRPRTVSVDVIVRPGRPPRGMATFDVPAEAGELRVVVWFGEGEDTPFVSLHRLDGHALGLVGRSLATGEPAPRPLGSASDFALSREAPGSRTIH